MPFGQIVVLLCLSGLGYYSTLKVKLICVLFCFVFKVGVKILLELLECVGTK